jgi:hypothetical protein
MSVLRRGPRWGEAVLLGAALALYAALAVSSLSQQSATFDEGAHLPAGYTALALGDYRLNLEHPPLVKMLAAAPLLALRPRVDMADDSWQRGRQWKFGHRFLYEWNDADRLLLWGRLPVVALSVLLALAVWAWTRQHWGRGGAGAALGLCVLSPDVLAHGQLVTTDVGFALCLFLAVAAFERLTDRVTWSRLLAAAAACGAACATKFSAVVLLPVLGLLALAVALLPCAIEMAPAGLRARTMKGRTGRLLLAAGLLVALGAVGWAAVWAVYRFRYGIAPTPAASALLDWQLVAPPGGLLGTLAGFAREHHLVPEGYLFGFLQVLRLSAERPAFLWGELSATGWWYYFPVTFALKTPLPLLLLSGFALARAARGVLARRDISALRLELFVWLPVAVYWLLTLTRNLNIGHRHLLPIYPFLFVAAGRAAVALARRGFPGRTAVVVLGLWYAVGTLHVHPHPLAYFNELVGGPAQGYRYLVDSNLDWGQDLKHLKVFLDRAGIERVKLSYFGTADPAYYGIPGELLPGHILPAPARVTRRVEPGDVLAISATNLQGVYVADPKILPLFELLRGREPFAEVGYSILLYRADFRWSPGEGLQAEGTIRARTPAGRASRPAPQGR